MRTPSPSQDAPEKAERSGERELLELKRRAALAEERAKAARRDVGREAREMKRGVPANDDSADLQRTLDKVKRQTTYWRQVAHGMQEKVGAASAEKALALSKFQQQTFRSSHFVLKYTRLSAGRGLVRDVEMGLEQ